MWQSPYSQSERSGVDSSRDHGGHHTFGKQLRCPSFSGTLIRTSSVRQAPGRSMCVYTVLTARRNQADGDDVDRKIRSKESALIRRLNAHYFDADASAAHHDGHA